MNYLLDTNVVSEWMKPSPNAGVIEWLARADEDRLFLSVVTLAELRYGVERLAAGRRKTQLQEWLESDLRERFEGRIAPVDEAVAGIWGKLLAKSDAAGKPLGALDGFLAATAVAYEMTLVTRNEADFSGAEIQTLNPWGP